MDQDNVISLSVDSLQHNYINLTQDLSRQFCFVGMFICAYSFSLLKPTAASNADIASKMPHPLRTAAKGRPVFFVPIIIFVDDVSGNISKQWNKHFVCYSTNASLPREQLDKEKNVRFVCASPNLTPLELLQGVRESFEYALLPLFFRSYLN